MTVFLSAFLLFQLQPLIGKYILPWFGGTPAVWATCLLFFQVLLLLGYAYAHFLSSRLSLRAQGSVHLVLLIASLALMGLLTLRWTTAIFPDSSWRPGDGNHPIVDTVALLAAAVGIPYFVLSATSPLLQRWFSRLDMPLSPYRLYALSNAGSLLALISYPVLIEPALALETQAQVWSAGYALFAIGCAYCIGHVTSASSRAATVRERLVSSTASDRSLTVAAQMDAGSASRSAEIAMRDRLLWLLLPTCSSMMLVAGTNQICQEVAVIPFLWVLPLTLYLSTWMLLGCCLAPAGRR